MSKPSPPPVNLEILSSDARKVARLVRAPEHAWVKEFLRSYLGSAFATRAMIRTVAPRLAEDDALIGITLELVRTANTRILPHDAVTLVASTPRLPGPVVRENLVALTYLHDDVFMHYDRETCVRILTSLLHTIAQHYTRALDFHLHSSESLRYALSVRNELLVDAITDEVADPIPPHLAEVLADFLPELLNGEARDATFAANLLINEGITRRLSDAFVHNGLRTLAGFVRPPTTIALLEAVENPDLRGREFRYLMNLVQRAYRTDSTEVRAAAIRTLTEPAVRAARPNATTAMLRNALRAHEWPLTMAALDVIGSVAFDGLGKDGATYFADRVNRWIYSRNRAGSATRALLYIVENDSIRARLEESLRWNVLHRLSRDKNPDVRERAATVIRHMFRDAAEPAPSVEPEVPEHVNLGVLNHAVALITERQGVTLPDASVVRTWRDLDPEYDTPLPVPAVAARIDNRVLRLNPQLDVVVLRTPRDLDANANVMRNCTRSWRSFLFEGDRILVALRDTNGKPRYNADWSYLNEHWRLESCYGRANDTHVPITIIDALHRLTHRLNRTMRESAGRQYGR